jgi:hypothetical protein
MKAVTRRRRVIYSVVVLTIVVAAVAYICRPLPEDEVFAMLKATTIPHVSFKDATFAEAVDEILVRAAQQNPRVRQIKKYIYREPPNPRVKTYYLATPGPGITLPAVIPPPIPGLDDVPVSPGSQWVESEPRLTIDLVNVPAIEALKEVSALANLQYTIRPGAVGFYPIRLRSAPPFTPLEKAEWRWKISSYAFAIPSGGIGTDG